MPAREWAQRLLEAFRQRWDAQLAAGQSAPESDAWQRPHSVVEEAIHALGVYGYAGASSMDQNPLRTIIARILSIRCGTGVEYKFDNAWAVINAIRCDRGVSALKWHTLYLIAIRTYQPILTNEQAEKVAQWRAGVKSSIESGDTTYVRDTVYDRLIGLLFPETRTALNNPFGTPLQILDTDYDAEVAVSAAQPLPALSWTSGDALLRGRVFDEWAHRNPEAARAWLESPVGKQHREQITPQEAGLASNQYGQWKRKRT